MTSKQLAEVDVLEGHPKVYTRMPIDLELLTNGREVTADCYFMLNHNPKLELGVKIDNYTDTEKQAYVPKYERYVGHDDTFIDNMMDMQWKNPIALMRIRSII